jgi:uracil-DNA glycosylase family 4
MDKSPEIERLDYIPVPGEGPLDAKICIIGEAAGTNETKLRRPFVGASGDELNRILQQVGITRSSCYITNVIKEQPPGNDISHFVRLDAKSQVITNSKTNFYLMFLEQELASCSANVFITMGNTALWALTERVGILKWRGSILESSLLPGRKVVPTIHPRAVLPPTGVYLWRYNIAHDLRRAKEESEFPELRMDQLETIVAPDFYAARAFLERCAGADIVDIDIEIYKDQVSCIGFSYQPDVAMCIPFVDESGNYWNPEQEAEIWRAIAILLETRTVKKRGQNILFDIYFLLHRHGIRTCNIEDTMIAQGIAFPDFPKGLDYISSVHTRIPYYKDEGKRWNRIIGGWKQLWYYNCKDVLSTQKAWPSLETELRTQRNFPTYERQRNIVEPLAFMQERGIRMNVFALRSAAESVEREVAEMTEKFYSFCGAGINPNSPKQLKDYFYRVKSYIPYKNRKTGAISVNADALKRLARKGSVEAQILLEIRKLSKLKDTYLDVQLDEDSRLRCSFNPVGAESGRLSSSRTIFGTGTNLQNIPYEVRQFMLFDEDYIGYEIDLSQAENRIVAYVGNVVEMMRAFEAEQDVHKLTAGLIYQKAIDEVSPGERQWGKRANHGLNYDLGYRTFALYYEISENDAKYIVDRYHQAYPGIRQSFHIQVRQMLSVNRTVVNCMDRRRLFLDRWGDELFKSAYSFIPQSTVADIINERGINYIYYNSDFAPIELLLQIHDSIVFQIPRTLPLDDHASLLWRIKRYLETPLRWKSNSFVIPAEIKASSGHMGKGSGGFKELPSSSPDALSRSLLAMFSD